MIESLPTPKVGTCVLGGIEILSDETLFEACGVRIAFTGRDGGSSSGDFKSLNVADWVGDDIGLVLDNRLRIARMLDAEDARFVIPTQVHKTEVIHVESDEVGKTLVRCASEAPLELEGGALDRLPFEADIVIVEPAGTAALMLSADCLLFIVVSPSGRFAIGHAGWRGAVAHVARKAVEELAACDDCSPADYNAYIGPHIGVECFEVGADVAQKFVEEFGREVVAPSGNVDLAQAVTLDFAAAGMRISRIADVRICTKCNADRYFSYRAADGRCGRQAVVAFKTRRKNSSTDSSV